jgi:crossover junction endodeoxyribonuclease RuvC
MTRRTIGIDCGLNGAIALVVDGDLVAIRDMPTVTLERNGKNKRQVSVPELVDIIKEFDPTEAYAEKVFAMAGQGVTSVFSLGRSLGVVEGALTALRIKTTLMTPQTWIKAMGVIGGKDGSRARAMELFPYQAQQFKRVKDDGRSDASLIALWGYKHG